MKDESQWKDRYLQALQRLERRESLWSARVDLLRRGLVRTSLAAEGADRDVDECMRELRKALRSDDYDGPLDRLIPRLEDVLLASENQRQAGREQLVGAFRRLLEQLLAMSPPADSRKALRRLLNSLDKRIEAGELPSLLNELAGVQGSLAQAQGEPSESRGGFLSRLFGGRGGEGGAAPEPEPALKSESQALAEPAPSATPAEPPAPAVVPEVPASAAQEDSAPIEAISAEPESREQTDAAATPEVASEGEAVFELPPSPEPAYSVIAERIAEVLLGILEALALPENFHDQAAALGARIREGLNWYELVPALENLAVLVLAVKGDRERDFQTYLESLDRRLALLQETLGGAREGHQQGAEASRELDRQVREQVSGLRRSVTDASDLDGLKRAVESRMDTLLGSLDAYQQQRQLHEREVDARFQSLVERVQEMEREAEGSRAHLEEQRRQALLDPLTGIANRAAWNERLELEMARHRRSGGDLLLAVLDLDRFKQINDGFGHLAGDKVLKIVAGEMARRLRQTDFLARFGGEEFVLLLPDTALAAGQGLLVELLANIEACPFHFRGERVTVTLSAGVTAVSVGEAAEDAFERADGALYQAKHQGRNRVCLG